jgi:hypothetical protein
VAVQGADQGNTTTSKKTLIEAAGHHRSGLQIDRVLGLVRQVRASILHLGDLGIRIMGMGPA